MSRRTIRARKFPKTGILWPTLGGMLLHPMLALPAWAAGEITPMDTLLNASLQPYVAVAGMSADGSTVVGTTSGDPNNHNYYRAVKWSSTGAVFELATLTNEQDPYRTAYGYGISSDGNVIVGKSRTQAGDENAVYWHVAAAGPSVPTWQIVDMGKRGAAYAASQTGSVIVGIGEFNTGFHAFRWQGGNFQDLGTLGGGSSSALGVSANGDVVIGSSDVGGYVEHAFRWENGTMTNLGTLNSNPSQQATTKSYAYGVSADGSVVVGRSSKDTGGFAPMYAFRWENGVMTDLGTIKKDGLDGLESGAAAVSGDGKVVVGGSRYYDGTWRGVRWEKTGANSIVAQTVEDWLRANGVTVAQDMTFSANATNADGSVVAGLLKTGPGASDYAPYIARVSSTSGGNTPGTPGGGNAPSTPNDSNTPDTPAGGNTPGTPSGGNAPSTPSGSNTPDTPAGGNTPDTPAGGNTPGNGLLVLDGQTASSLGSAAAITPSVFVPQASVVHGAHGRPLSYRIDAGQKTVWAAGDWGRDDHSSRDGDVGLAEIGLGYNFGPAQLNASVGRTWANQDLVLNGDLDNDGTYALAEMLMPITGKLWGVLSGYYNWGDVDIQRGYLNAGMPDFSKGSTDTETWALRGRLELDTLFNVVGFSFNPYGEFNYIHARIDAYTETFGGFPAEYQERQEHATDVRIGVNGSKQLFGSTKLLGVIEAVHRFDGDGDPVSGTILGAGGFAFNLPGYQSDEDWVQGGVGFESRIGPGTASLMVNASTEGEMPNTWLAARYQLTF